MTDQRCDKTVRDNGRPAQCHRPPGQPWHHAGNTWWLTDWPGGMHQSPDHEPGCTTDHDLADASGHPAPIGDFDCCHDGTAAAQLAHLDGHQVDGHPSRSATQPERDNQQ
jgi:hypothetical protein